MIPKNRFRVSITSKCNMKCIYCHNEGSMIGGEHMPIDDFVNVLNLAKSLALSEIRLTGGEPLIHPEIRRICDLIKMYGMRVSINTNLVKSDVLMDLLEHGLVDCIVVGIDYFDSVISKQSSIGLSSQTILNKILEIQLKYGNIISLATVYDGNIENLGNLVQFCINNNIRIKIIERQDMEIDVDYVNSYKTMQDIIMNRFKLTYVKDEYDEINGYLNDIKLLSFFHSFCRINRCDLCKAIQLRVTYECKVKRCIFDDSLDFSCYDIDAFSKLLQL